MKKLKNSLASAVVNSGFSIGTTYANEKIHHSFWEKKHKPTLDEDFDDIHDMIDNLRRKANKLRIRKKAENDCHIAPRTVSEILAAPCVQYKKLLGSLIWEGGITTLFSPTKLGKTSFLFQSSLEISKGQRSTILPPDYEDEEFAPQRVLYYDLESDDSDFQDRYGDSPEIFDSPNFSVVYGRIFSTAGELLADLKNNLQDASQNTVVVIDNLSMIGDAKYPAKTEAFFKALREFQSRFKEHGLLLTFVVVAHTHKTSKDKVELEDIFGSSNFANLSRSVVVIEKSGLGKEFICLKQLVCRKKRDWDEDQVLVLKRIETPYLHFQFHALMNEDEALAGSTMLQEPKPQQKPGPESTRHPELRPEQILELKVMVDAYEAHKADATVPYEVANGVEMNTKKAMAKHFGIPDSYVDRYLKKL